jgi:predicted secreted protein
MMRIASTVLLALACAVGADTARGGDGAALNVLGFSADGRFFAFEQYGEQDGSGSLYASISAIVIGDGRPVKGLPVTALMNPEDPALAKEPREQRLAAVRAKAAADAAPLLQQIRIAEAGNPTATVPSSRSRARLDAEEVKSVSKASIATVALPAKRFGTDARLQLREFDIALPRCKDLVPGDHPSGFGLTLERKGRPTIHLSRDQTIPASRGCPNHYGIAEVHALPLADGSTALAVLIQYFYMAFEGPDRRFIAVTGRVR